MASKTTWVIGEFKIDFPKAEWNLSIVDIPVRGGMRLVFSYKNLIGFAQAMPYETKDTVWMLRNNQWGINTGKHMDYLKSYYPKYVVLEGKDFYRTLNDVLEHPRILLDMAAREARESLRGL